jgi:hypothetical protein
MHKPLRRVPIAGQALNPCRQAGWSLTQREGPTKTVLFPHVHRARSRPSMVSGALPWVMSMDG